MFELLLVIGLIVPWIQVLLQRQRLAQLERSIEVLEKIHRAQSVWIETLDTRFGLAPPAGRPLPEATARAAPPAAASDSPSTSAPSALPPPPPRPPQTVPSSPLPPEAFADPPSVGALPGPAAAASKLPPLLPATPPLRPSSPPLWTQLERLFSEHWSGIPGVLVLVAGVTFLAINVALRRGPFQRVLVVAMVSLAMGLPSALVGRRPPWRDLTAWMRSGGAALFLFACTSAGAFPQLGLRWIDDPLATLAMVVPGVALNLALAGIARTQTIASLHVVINLVPLLIVPQTLLTLAMASGVALVGDLLPRGRPWNRHLLIVTWAYGLHHAVWFQQSAPLLAADPGLRLPAALAAVVVFGGSALRQQRSRQVPDRLQGLPLALQLSDWGALALALTALTLLGLWRRARRRGWRWLQLSNVLLAQFFVLAAPASLQPSSPTGPCCSSPCRSRARSSSSSACWRGMARSCAWAGRSPPWRGCCSPWPARGWGCGAGVGAGGDSAPEQDPVDRQHRAHHRRPGLAAPAVARRSRNPSCRAGLGAPRPLLPPPWRPPKRCGPWWPWP